MLEPKAIIILAIPRPQELQGSSTNASIVEVISDNTVEMKDITSREVKVSRQ